MGSVLYIKQERNESAPPVEENETMLVSVKGHMKIRPGKKLSDWFIAGLAARKCQHYIIRGNNSVEINGSISQPSTPSLIALCHSVLF